MTLVELNVGFEEWYRKVYRDFKDPPGMKMCRYDATKNLYEHLDVQLSWYAY